mmetsp:Transcript_12692/g.14560  ORF Transcript_12692/g.14560 Transcript_12692/m.14560 type:complete len:437 (+) Transcript_12692:166-1476(+)
MLDFLDFSNPGYVVGYALLAFAVLKFIKDYATCPEIYGRHGFKSGSYKPGSFKRKQLNELRARCGQFPKPYPNGWYKIADSEEVPKGKVLTVTALGRELVVFRGDDGRVGVLNAFCPHLGTHLGHGGIVKGNNLVCPYHLWEFDACGNNKKIPYCKKDMSNSNRVNAKAYHSLESKALGSVFLWFDADGREPQWELHPGLREIEEWVEEGKMRSVWHNRWEDMLLHVFEPSQNSADDFHFQTVHQYLPMPFNLKILNVNHKIRSAYGKAASTSEIDPNDPEFSNLGPTELMIRETIEELRFMDLFPLPQFIADFICTHVHIQGPNNVVFKVDTPVGRFRAHFALLPIEPFRQKATMRMYADKTIPWIVARTLQWWIRETADQDRQVWEHKVHISPRNLVIGDGPFAQYGKWLRQFYSEKSQGWETIVPGGKSSLDW